MRIALIGFMGSGKTTVAAVLGERMGFAVVDLDEVTLKLSGAASIPDVFAAEGEGAFRRYESEALRSLVHEDNVVISTGGGVVMCAENEGFIRGPGAVTVYLEAGFEELARRIGAGAERPLFRDREKARTLFDQRRFLYEAMADYRVITEGKTPLEVAAEIQACLERRA